MAMSVTRRPGRVLVARSVHPDYRQILATYLANLDVELVTLDTPDGTLDPETLARRGQRSNGLRARAASQLLRLPGRDGNARRDRPRRRSLARGQRRSDQLGAAQAAGRLQAPISSWPKGSRWATPMQFGGPYLGIMACREQFVRRMPGRLVGQTVDRRGDAAGCSRCKPASSTSAAKRPPATSARTRDCLPCGRPFTLPRWGRTGWPT